jgi:hypothetical protein
LLHVVKARQASYHPLGTEPLQGLEVKVPEAIVPLPRLVVPTSSKAEGLCYLHVEDIASWLSTLLGSMAKLAIVVACVVLCRLLIAVGAAGGASTGATVGTSLRPGLGSSARLELLAALTAARRGRGLPLLPVTLAGLPLFPSEM